MPPANEGASSMTFSGCRLLFIGKDCKNPEAAFDFIAYALSSDVVLKRANELKVPVVLNSLLDEYAALDVGFIAKGYIADRLKEYLTAQGVTSGIINLGGNVLTIGNKDGEAFRVGIQKPFERTGTALMCVESNDSSVVTSGVYERYFSMDKKIYHHILGPSTGYPIDNELLSVTILSKDSTTGDALSTSCLLFGLEKGRELIESMDGVEAIFVTKDYEIIKTDTLP